MLLAKLALTLLLSLAQLSLTLPLSALAQCPPGVPSCPLPQLGGKRPQGPARDPGPPPADAPKGHDATLPRPWKTAVRIKISDGKSTSIGSGTVVVSDATGSVVMTCAHVFRFPGVTSPSSFPHRVAVDLFDGQLVTDRRGQGQLRYLETHPGSALDWDDGRDVGLIAFRPGRTLDATPVVAVGYKVRKGEKFTTIGCDAGADATAWTAACLDPSVRLDGQPAYKGFECTHNPPQGRSGGGAYTVDGRLAGVCDFGSTSTDSGIYAAPESLHAILQRNGLLEAALRSGVSVEVGKPSRPSDPPALPVPQPAPVGPWEPPALPPSRLGGDASRLIGDIAALPWANVLLTAALGLGGFAAFRSVRPAPQALPAILQAAPAPLRPDLLGMFDELSDKLGQVIALHDAEAQRKADAEARLAKLRPLVAPEHSAAPAPTPSA